jgi:hypothetical protein
MGASTETGLDSENKSVKSRSSSASPVGTDSARGTAAAGGGLAPPPTGLGGGGVTPLAAGAVPLPVADPFGAADPGFCGGSSFLPKSENAT